MELLTDLSIGVDGRAVRPFQDFIAKELFQVNEADACRRRPAPESEDNPWQFKSIRLDDHIKQTEQETAGKNKKKGHLAELIRVKDYFTLIRLGTAVHFNPLPDGIPSSFAPIRVASLRQPVLVAGADCRWSTVLVICRSI